MKWTRVVLLGLAAAMSASAQTAAQPKTLAVSKPEFPAVVAAAVTCGVGASETASAVKPTLQCGGSVRAAFLQLEAGGMGSQTGPKAAVGYLSIDAWLPIFEAQKLTKSNDLPYVVGGYTQMFQARHALDFGVGYGVPLTQELALEFEVKDYWTPGQNSQHNVVLRVSWVLGSNGV